MLEGWRWLAAALCPAVIASGAVAAEEKKAFTTEVVKLQRETGKPHRETGMASFYRHTGRTASGMKVRHGMTAAHRRLPFGSRVRVRDIRTGREVVVVITDRGPFRRSRVIDLSHRAASELGITGRGVARVEVSAAE